MKDNIERIDRVFKSWADQVVPRSHSQLRTMFLWKQDHKCPEHKETTLKFVYRVGRVEGRFFLVMGLWCPRCESVYTNSYIDKKSSEVRRRVHDEAKAALVSEGS